DESLAKGVKINVDMDLKKTSLIAGNPSELREIFINIIFNAIEALSKGGNIALSTWMENDYVMASVKDNGIGMNEEVKAKIFEPFFTLKGEKGTGLGLSIVYGIVSKHQGSITVDSEPGEGTNFVLEFPLASLTQKEEKEISIIDFQPANILVIDDEKNIRDMVLEMLTIQGHSVTLAVDGTQGIEFFRRKDYDLVLTDLTMPDITGWEVSKAIKSINTAIKVALMTGWGVQIEKEEAKLKGIDYLISKPFKENQLLFVVSEAMKAKKNYLPEKPVSV
ncbi:MAG: ATP-binding protein, partial [candidate division Zixibacteria bacterium]|nr:ATP-binding protein [candidate division Zixibacteria bacterium]